MLSIYLKHLPCSCSRRESRRLNPKPNARPVVNDSLPQRVFVVHSQDVDSLAHRNMNRVGCLHQTRLSMGKNPVTGSDEVERTKR